MLNLYIKFKAIKNCGYIESSRRGSTGIGKTFEDMLGKNEDNFEGPDFGDIEIKTQRKLSNSYITLFTKAPTAPENANTILKNEYGENGNLYTTIYGDKENNQGFKIVVDKIKKKIYITNKEEKICSYDFETIFKKIDLKLKRLALIIATEKEKKFWYNKMLCCQNIDKKKIIKLIECGDIMIDIRISTKANGKTHDHGTAFRIRQKNLPKIYKEIFWLN